MIKECNVDGEEVVRHGQLNLVDLAGSECVGRSGAKNDRAREAGSINQSLLTLGRVITALVDHHGHIPYRDSKLTRLLQESLGGKAKTCIIATLSPSQNAVEESMSTLDYAYRAKNIKNQPTLNQRMTKKVVLKEYCAEIEQLKSALAANRDKNGVYVDPKEFFAMESKISTQESMLTECEAALKARNEENKTLKNERESVLEQVSKAEENLELSKNQLAIVQVSLDETKSKLSETELELRATEAVVGEQISTEEELQIQGNNLQNEVIDRRENVSSLFGKVDRFAEKENLRLIESSSFVTEISSSKSNLLDSLNELRKLSSEKSGSLCNGVSEMLEKGRTTCSTLKTSIDQSLSTLIGDAEAAKNKMSDSCDELKEHLDETNTNLQSTLKTLQEQLSSWLGDVDNNMKQVQEKLKMQQNELDNLLNNISSSSTDYINLSDKFIQNQANLLEESSNNVIELKTELNNQIESNQVQSVINNNLAIEKINKNAVDMELAMSSMFKNIVTSTIASFTESQASTSNFSSSIQNISSSGFDKIQKSQSTISSSFKENINELQQKVTTSTDIYNNAISNASSSRVVVDEMISNISNTVGDKRQNLIDTVDNLLDNVNTSIKHGCNVTNETSKTANLILTDVTNATETMNNNAINALESFTTFMDGKGQYVCQDMTSYFSSLETKLSSNHSQISSIGDRVNEFGNSVESTVLQPTGTTPKKQKFNELTKLPLTRDHNVIKNEVRGCDVIKIESNIEDDFSSISSNESRTSIPFSDNGESSVEKKRKKINIVVDCENVNPNIVETEDVVVGSRKTRASKIQRSKSTESSSIPSISSRTRNSSMI
jgi:kinesin family protein 11